MEEEINRAVENMDQIPANVYRYLILAYKNSKVKDIVYEKFKKDIDEFIDIYGIRNIPNYEQKLIKALIEKRARIIEKTKTSKKCNGKK